MSPATKKLIQPSEIFRGQKISLRLLTLADCQPYYLAWLKDPQVNQYLETRWSEQTLDSIRAFVQSILESDHSYLFAILENSQNQRHIGNIKIGPIQPTHLYADVSYFIGERSAWGKGYASEAIQMISDLGFEKLGLHRVQAGVYETNAGSIKALEKAGYAAEGKMKQQLKGPQGWEDHLWFGKIKTR